MLILKRRVDLKKKQNSISTFGSIENINKYEANSIHQGELKKMNHIKRGIEKNKKK